jgi:hypothetical protein
MALAIPSIQQQIVNISNTGISTININIVSGNQTKRSLVFMIISVLHSIRR